MASTKSARSLGMEISRLSVNAVTGKPLQSAFFITGESMKTMCCKNTVNPMCPTSDRIEDTEHFLLFCPSFDFQRQDLLAGIVELLRPAIQIADLSNDALTQLSLCGDHNLSNDMNRSKLELT